MKFNPSFRQGGAPSSSSPSFSIQQLLLLGLVVLSTPVAASIGDRLPEFKECIRVGFVPYFPGKGRTRKRGVAWINLGFGEDEKEMDKLGSVGLS